MGTYTISPTEKDAPPSCILSNLSYVSNILRNKNRQENIEDEPTLHQPSQRSPTPILNFKNTQKNQKT